MSESLVSKRGMVKNGKPVLESEMFERYEGSYFIITFLTKSKNQKNTEEADYSSTYPEGFFDLFGADKDSEMMVAEEPDFKYDSKKEKV